MLKAGARGGEETKGSFKEKPSCRLSVVTHHDNNGSDSGLPAILNAAAMALAVEGFYNDGGGGGGGGGGKQGGFPDNGVVHTVVSSHH